MEPYRLTKQVFEFYENRGRAKIGAVDWIPLVKKSLVVPEILLQMGPFVFLFFA